MSPPRNNELRLISEAPNSILSAVEFCKFLNEKKITHNGYRVNRTDTKQIIFVFSSSQIKESILQFPNFSEKLKECKFKPLNETPYCNTAHRTVFIRNLKACNFFFVTRADGNETDETLESKINQFKEDLKTTPIHGLEMEDFHFIRNFKNDGSGERLPPRAMTITFSSLKNAENFIKSDTYLPQSWIPATDKQFNRSFNIRQCNVCKQTNHRKGDTSCTNIKKCYRCLSADHPTPTAHCVPTCWSCGPGHQSSSTICPINRTYAKEQRQSAQRNENIAKELETTNPEMRNLHRQLLRYNNSNRQNSASYSSVAKRQRTNNLNQTNETAAPPPTDPASWPPLPPNRPPPEVDVTRPPPTKPNTTSGTSKPAHSRADIYHHAYVHACTSESVLPGSFQTVLNEVYEMNGVPLMLAPTPHPSIIDAFRPPGINPIARPISPIHTSPATSPPSLSPRTTPQNSPSKHKEVTIHNSQTPSSSKIPVDFNNLSDIELGAVSRTYGVDISEISQQSPLGVKTRTQLAQQISNKRIEYSKLLLTSKTFLPKIKIISTDSVTAEDLKSTFELAANQLINAIDNKDIEFIPNPTTSHPLTVQILRDMIKYEDLKSKEINFLHLEETPAPTNH